MIIFNLFFLKTAILTLFRSICEAAQYMHTMKPHPLAHRDIKTSNVLLKDDFTPLLMDFGKFYFSFDCFKSLKILSCFGNKHTKSIWRPPRKSGLTPKTIEVIE